VGAEREVAKRKKPSRTSRFLVSRSEGAIRGKKRVITARGWSNVFGRGNRGNGRFQEGDGMPYRSPKARAYDSTPIGKGSSPGGRAPGTKIAS